MEPIFPAACVAALTTLAGIVIGLAIGMNESKRGPLGSLSRALARVVDLTDAIPVILVGVVGLEACVHLHRSCELGYWLRKDATHRGLMTEASKAALDFAFRTMGAHRVRVAAATDNHPSLSVIARLGFRFEGIARQAEWCDGRWLDHAAFSLLATDAR